MMRAYEEAKKLGYNAVRFYQMLRKDGGVETAKALLAKHETQAGLAGVWEIGRLDLSMESIVLEERFRALFNDAERNEAKRRLDELNRKT